MNLYDELITILQDGKELGFTYDEIDAIIKALERAKKVENLSLLRRRLIETFNTMIENFTSINDFTSTPLYKALSRQQILLENKIVQLEEEMK